MPRDLPLTNGRFYVNFDRQYCIRDIYYPCCARENHSAGHKFRFGLWVDGTFSWMGPDWEPRLDYSWESLLTHVVAENPGAGIRLHFSDAIDFIEDIYIKRIEIFNLLPVKRDVRLFFHQDFHIYETAESDTAYYDPDEDSIIHYKKDRYFLMGGMRDGRPGLDQFTTGIKEFRKLEGAWRDAEDGVLAGNTIAQGSVDSAVGFHTELPPSGQKTLYYWMTAGFDYETASALAGKLKEAGPEFFLDRTDRYWRAWVNKEPLNLSSLPPKLRNLFKRSLLIMRTNVDSGGAILAAQDYDTIQFAKDTYGYVWPRDSALICHALDRAGFGGISRKFFEFCRGLLEEGKERNGYFLHKYMADGCLGSSWHPWFLNGKKQLPIQEDSTGLVLWALWKHYEIFRDIEFILGLYGPVVVRCADFMCRYIHPELGLPMPSYDLWEEEWGIHTYTCSAVHAGLMAAEKFALLFEESERAEKYRKAALGIKSAMERHLYHPDEKRFLKGIYPREDGTYEKDRRVDASTHAPFYFGLYDAGDERIEGTMRAIMEKLRVGKDGGFARYEGDKYYLDPARSGGIPGNPWFICTLWVAQWQIARARTREELDEGLRSLEKIAGRARPSGVLAEQIDPLTDEPISASPLTWSHATLVSAILEYLKKIEEIEVCPTCGQPLYKVRA